MIEETEKRPVTGGEQREKNGYSGKRNSKGEKKKLTNQNITKFLVRTVPKERENVGSSKWVTFPVGNDRKGNVGGSGLNKDNNYPKPDPVVYIPGENTQNDNSGCLKGQLLTDVVKQQQPVVEQNRGSVTEICGCTDSSVGADNKCTE